MKVGGGEGEAGLLIQVDDTVEIVDVATYDEFVVAHLFRPRHDSVYYERIGLEIGSRISRHVSKVPRFSIQKVHTQCRIVRSVPVREE
jgi:Ser-tRNA(Ala) deacylase AlaX